LRHVIKSQLKIGYEKMYTYFFLYSYKSEQKANEIKNNVFIIKWDKRQGRKNINEKWKQKKSVSNFFFFKKRKRKHIWVRDDYKLWKN